MLCWLAFQWRSATLSGVRGPVLIVARARTSAPLSCVCHGAWCIRWRSGWRFRAPGCTEGIVTRGVFAAPIGGGWLEVEDWRWSPSWEGVWCSRVSLSRLLGGSLFQLLVSASIVRWSLESLCWTGDETVGRPTSAVLRYVLAYGSGPSPSPFPPCPLRGCCTLELPPCVRPQWERVCASPAPPWSFLECCWAFGKTPRGGAIVSIS